MANIERARSALNHLDAGCSREDWIRIGISAKSAGLSFDDFHDWSSRAGNYNGERDCETAWKSFNDSGGITAATLFHYAHAQGWKEPATKYFTPNQAHFTQENKNTFQRNEGKPNTRALDIWERCLPALASHHYILRKQGKPDGLRYYPSTEPPLIINGKDVTDYLVLPCLSNGEIQTLQFIPPNAGDKKLNLDGASFGNGFFVVGEIKKKIYLCEGIGQAWAINKVTDDSAVVCFGAGRMMTIAKVLRDKYPHMNLIVVPDQGKEKQATEIATAVTAQYIVMPPQCTSNDDVNDYLLEYGESSLRDLLMSPVFVMPLNVVFTDELSEEFTPPDELVEGVLIAGDGSILYGDSNRKMRICNPKEMFLTKNKKN